MRRLRSTHARVRSPCSFATGTTVTCRAPSIVGRAFTVSTVCRFAVPSSRR